jgi:glycosyltransferase involved in cell wall biosynthesis
LLKLDDDAFLLVHYGHLYPSKGVEHLLAALGRVVRRGLDVQLVVVGGAIDHPQHPEMRRISEQYLRGLRRLCQEEGIEARVHWCGTCPAEGIEASVYLYAADAGVFPFDRGAHLNNSSLAAAAIHRLPIVSTRVPTTEPAFRDRENALLCPPKDPDALAAAIGELAGSAALRATLAAGAATLDNDHFRWDTAIARTLEVLGTTARSTSGAGLRSARTQRAARSSRRRFEPSQNGTQAAAESSTTPIRE